MARVGVGAVFHTTPFARMLPLPAEIPEPPPEADDSLMEEIVVVVVTDGAFTAIAETVGAPAVR